MGKILKKAVKRILQLRTKHVRLSADELFIQQGIYLVSTDKHSDISPLDSRGFDIIACYLALEGFFDGNSQGLRLYRRMIDERASEEERYRGLAESIMEHGFQGQEAELDSDLHIAHGAELLAITLYSGIKEVPCKVRPYRIPSRYGLPWFVEHGFSSEDMAILLEKAEELYLKNRQDITCILWPPVYKYFDEITGKLSLLYDVRNVRDIEFKGECFSRAVKAVYSIDDIAEWKISKKLGGFKPYPQVIRVLELGIAFPHFRLEGANTVSTEGEKLKKLIRKSYMGRIKDYFLDLVFHTGDNYTHSRFISDLLAPRFSLRDYFDAISGQDYMIVKLDSDYLPDDFPDSYPFGKDIDIISSRDSLLPLKDLTVSFLKERLSDDYDVKVRESEGRILIRIEIRGSLILQFDLGTGDEDIGRNFIAKALESKVLKDNYHIPRMEDELVFRAFEGAKYSKASEAKIKHIDYIIAHQDSWNPLKAKEALPRLWEEAERLLEKRKAKA